jgi:hypothetical protein
MFTHEYKDIIAVENLFRVWEKFRSGKRNKRDVISYEANLATNIIDLHTALKNKTYKHEPYTAFNISDPKPRNIHKASVRDRVVHHLIYKEIYWYFHYRFIHDIHFPVESTRALIEQ